MEGHQYNFSSNQLNSIHQCDDTLGQEQRSFNNQRIRSRAGSVVQKDIRHNEKEESIIKQEENMTTFMSDYQERSRKLTNEGIEKKVGTSDSLDFQEGTQEKQQIKEEDEESEKSERVNFRQEVSQFTNSSNVQEFQNQNRSSQQKVSNILASIDKENNHEQIIILKSDQTSIDNQRVLEDNLQGISPINNRQSPTQDMPFLQPTINLISLQKIENSQYQLCPITEQSEDQVSLAKNQFSDQKNSQRLYTPVLNPQPVQTAIFDNLSNSEPQQQKDLLGENKNSPKQQFQSILSDMPRVMLYTINKGQAISQPSSPLPIPLPQIPQVQPLQFQQLQLQQQIQQQQLQNIHLQGQSNLVNSQSYSTTRSQQKLIHPQEQYGSGQFYQIPQQILQPMTFNEFNQAQQNSGINTFKNTSSAMQDRKIYGELEFSLNGLNTQTNSNNYNNSSGNNIFNQQQQVQQQQTNQILEKLIQQLQSVIRQKDEQIQQKDNTLYEYTSKVSKLDELFKNISQQYQNENFQLKEQFQLLQNELLSIKRQKSSVSLLNQQNDQLKQENQDLNNELKELEIQRRVLESKLKEISEERDQFKQQITELNQILDKVNQENKSYKISYKTLEKQNQDLLQQISTLKAEQMCQEYLKSHQSYIATSTQLDSQQFLSNHYSKNFKTNINNNNNSINNNNNNLNNLVLNTQETSEENLTENSSSHQLNYVGNSNLQNTNKLSKLQDKLLNQLRGQSQFSQNSTNSKHERSSSASINLLSGKKNLSNYQTPSRQIQSNRTTNISAGRERNPEQHQNGNQQDSMKFDQNQAAYNHQYTPYSGRNISSGSSSGGQNSNQMSSYRLLQATRRNQQTQNSEEKTVTFANQEIPQMINEKIDPNFVESVALEDLPNSKQSEDLRYYSAQSNSNRQHYHAGRLTDVNNSPVINPFTENQATQVPSSSRAKSFSNYQNYYDPNNADNNRFKITPDKPSEQGYSKEKLPSQDSGKKEYLNQNRPKLNNIKGYLGESQNYNYEQANQSQKNGRYVRQEQQTPPSFNNDNQLFSKIAQTKATNNYLFNPQYEQLQSQLKNLKDCQQNLEYEVGKLRGGRDEDNERKNMLNLELTIIKKEIAQIQAKMTMV
ncbi:hypothetical protein TTHERM_00499290 (macronuclear) [Tetrahymena thermophila SB210]|uniref:Uncharacterized protein n=1 Tax=Tetrahymena thermophila (strain SB210) TaxID=312017 RepID=I7MLE4_TETTS|nr:hypothetical protein TTHERM_00499290 [Tetrahymena thermophila SB210]EAS01942.2 hypothetical protein TTHERM_00499290 [Tetrahymena thermophila SB210]|eukprot:XP_001022187.2 hypothetical protein TTHERM_00499290 [Tetrahymena thermophila SB210]